MNNFTVGSQASKESESVVSVSVSSTTEASGDYAWLDKFKLTPGSWRCSGCHFINAAINKYCAACDKFNFGFPTSPSSSTNFGSSGTGAGDTDTADAAGVSGHIHEEEENYAYFQIGVETGEEDEDVLYQHRAMLYRLADGEWKKRGIGDVKILLHKTNNKLRVVMRLEQVRKICLNHALNKDVEYKSMDDKSWLFVVNDYSEGKVQLEKLSLRFKTKDIAEDFMNAVKSALSSASDNNTIQTAGLNGHSSNENPNNVIPASTPPTA